MPSSQCTSPATSASCSGRRRSKVPPSRSLLLRQVRGCGRCQNPGVEPWSGGQAHQMDADHVAVLRAQASELRQSHAELIALAARVAAMADELVARSEEDTS